MPLNVHKRTIHVYQQDDEMPSNAHKMSLSAHTRTIYAHKRTLNIRNRTINVHKRTICQDQWLRPESSGLYL